MEMFLRATKLLDNFSQKQTYSVQKRLCSVGRQIDGFIENTSTKNGYIIQVLLRLPIILAMHVWLLLGPATENRAFDLPLLCIRLFGALEISRSWMFGTEALLLYYVSIFGELCIGYVEEAWYWTFQNIADNVCYMTNVIAWGDDDDFWCMPIMIMILIQTTYFWLFTRIRFNMLDASSLVFIPFLSVLILPVFGIFQNATSTAAFCVNKVRLTIFMINKCDELEFIDKVFDLQKLNAEIERYKRLQRIEKTKSLRRIKHLEQRVNVNREFQHILNHITTNKFIQHILLSFGICYFSAALTLELLVFRTSVSHALDFYFVIQVFIEWSTSLAIVLVLASFFGLIGSLLNGLGVWLITWDVDFVVAVNSSNGIMSQLIFLSLLIESGIPSNYFNRDIESSIVVLLSVMCGSLTSAFLQTTRKILEISNRGSTLPVWFYFRVLIVIVAFVVAPVSVSVIVSNFLMIDPWMLFFSSGCAGLISEALFLGLEWSLISLTWYTDTYLTLIENCISYTRVAKQVSYILLMPFQIYCRYHIRSLRAWWMLRAGNLILSYILLVTNTVSQQVSMYRRRKRLLHLVNSFDNISYSYLSPVEQAEHVCSICFSVLEDGKALPCKHAFHKLCLQRWFQVKTVCPLCNKEICSVHQETQRFYPRFFYTFLEHVNLILGHVNLNFV